MPESTSPPSGQPGTETGVDVERLYATTRADVWAEEFAKVCPDVDRGTMLGWFANAIETGRKAGAVVVRTDRDRSGMGEAKRVYVGNVMVWAHAHAMDGPIDPEALALFEALEAWLR